MAAILGRDSNRLAKVIRLESRVIVTKLSELLDISADITYAVISLLLSFRYGVY